MAWSYRSDRSDEVYASTSGPAAATTEQLPRPPVDGENTDAVLNPPKPEHPVVEPEVKDVEAGPPKPIPTTGMSAEQIQKEKLGPAPPPTEEEKQKAIDEARKTSEKKETAAKK